MTATIDEDDWSDTATEPEDVLPPLQPRAYQIEMFQESMKQNTIVTMETGSGKTMIARLRIEAELERSPGKLTWFTTPNVELARQQARFLESQLPAYCFRSITGLDNVEFWTSQEVWDAALSGKHGVISTPQILLDALRHAFVSLANFSLLVFDEAHHANKGHPTNKIMQLFYHPLREREPLQVPHILGLSASPMISDKLSLIEQLEKNLNAVCRSPIANIEEYRRFVHLPRLVRLDYTTRSTDSSNLLVFLKSLVDKYKIEDDPQYDRRREDESIEAQQKFEKILRERTTSVLKQLSGLLSHATFMQESLGAWATDKYIAACVNKSQRLTLSPDDWLFSVDEAEKLHLQQILEPISRNETLSGPTSENVSDKVMALAGYLEQNYVKGSASIIFVQRKSTAWALKELLNCLPSLALLNQLSFSFVGATNILRKELADLADTATQNEYFAEFKAGKREVCVATQVMEEGIDIQSCDLVICFDHPANVKSFIQRRGRARRPDSRFVMLHCPEDKSAKYEKWETLENLMKEIYTSRRRRLDELEANEANAEYSDRMLRVESTGAILTIEDSRQHLHHFCNTLPQRTGRAESSPVYVLEGTHGESLYCKVILPASLPPEIQTVYAISSWRTETMAKKDVAFEAYKKLYEAGLVNDHLLPLAVEKSQDLEACEVMDSTSEVLAAFDPWGETRQLLHAGGQLYAHHICVLGTQSNFPELQLLLPERLHIIEFDLWLSRTCKATAQIVPVDGQMGIDCQLAARITKFLFQTTLARRLPNLTLGDYHLPYYIVPNYPPERLVSWFEDVQRLTPLWQQRIDPGVAYVIQRRRQPVPHFFTAEDGAAPGLLRDDGKIKLTKLSRRLDFNHPPTGAEPQAQETKVAECAVLNLSPGVIQFMAFIPTIMHHAEMALRARGACHVVLHSIGFLNMRHVTTALTAPGAGVDNFQRLEYLGDTLLKFHATVNVFCENPQMPESQLTFLENKIVNNARLRRSTRELGLDAYVSTNAFSAHEWTLDDLSTDKRTKKRQVSNKTLADVVEALIGAAYVDNSSPSDADAKVLRTLSHLLPEISWRSPAEHIHNLIISDFDSLIANSRLSSVEDMIHYRFCSRSLLAEALTHSTLQTSVRSYERLEFLGDAVIDLIVKEILFRSEHCFEEGEMHTRHITLVNKDILAFAAMRSGVSIMEKEVTVDGRGEAVVEEGWRRKCLLDFVTRTSVSEEDVGQRKHFMKTFESTKENIERELKEGKTYPWSDVYGLNAPKWCSDIVESVVGAVFVDSGADLNVCTEVLRTLGLMDMVERAAREKDVDFEQPIRKVRERLKGVKVDVKRMKGKWACRIKAGGQLKALVKGYDCAAEAESRAAELVLADMEMEEEVTGLGREDGVGEGSIAGEVPDEGSDEEENDAEVEVEMESRKRKRDEDDVEMDLGGGYVETSG